MNTMIELVQNSWKTVEIRVTVLRAFSQTRNKNFSRRDVLPFLILNNNNYTRRKLSIINSKS